MSSRDFMGERVPQHVQNLVIRNYCNQNNYQYLLSAVEYVMDGSYLILKQIIQEIKNLDGIGFYSIFGDGDPICCWGPTDPDGIRPSDRATDRPPDRIRGQGLQ